MAKFLKIEDIPEEERTPLVSTLVEIITLQAEQIQKLKDEIAILKNEKPKPPIKPSNLDKDTEKKKRPPTGKKRSGSAKKRKTQNLEIHEIKIIEPNHIPEGSVHKGYQDYVVQDLKVGSLNTCYKRARYQTPSGEYIMGNLPEEVVGTHFGSTLRAFILYQYHHAHVTQPLISEQLGEYGVDISVGQINRIITEKKEVFHTEKEDILSIGLELSNYVNVDDTGARHNGKNGYCTHIGNELFAYFKSTDSKSRVNFLKLLRTTNDDYVLNHAAFDYMIDHKLPKVILDPLRKHQFQIFESDKAWAKFLETEKITTPLHIRIITEGALIGSLISHKFNENLVIVSDDAPQFNVLDHALCWVHAERLIHKMIGFSDEHKKALESVRSDIWDLYFDLKEYQTAPDPSLTSDLEKRFDQIFTRETDFALLNHALARIYKNKSELLRVLDRPDIPIHNNLSENDIREYVKKRLISGSTRSDSGRRCRDTFTSLKKTCRKLGVSFWDYLIDRMKGAKEILPLSEILKTNMEKSFA